MNYFMNKKGNAHDKNDKNKIFRENKISFMEK